MSSIPSRSSPTPATPFNKDARRSSNVSYTNPTNPTEKKPKKFRKSVAKGKEKIQKTVKRIRGRHSHDYDRLISGGESEAEDDIFLPNSSIHKLPKLSPAQQEVFDLVSSGNVAELVEMGEKGQLPCDLLNALNFEGNTVLHIAAARQDEDMIETLCDKYKHCIELSVVQDVLLHAVQEGNVGIVKQLIKVIHSRGSVVRPPDAGGEQLAPNKPQNIDKIFHNSNFTIDVSAYLLAAQGQSFELMKIFYEMGHRIDNSHTHDCICHDCKHFSEIGKAIKHLNLSYALSNPYYICFVCQEEMKTQSDIDPLSYSFDLIVKLKETLNTTTNFNSQYEEIIQNLKEFTCQLLGQCKNMEEVHTFLKKKVTIEEHRTQFTDEEFPRLAWAINIHQKEFVAHPHCQMILYSQWVEGWPGWRKTGKMMGIFHGLSRIILFIPMALICLCCQSTKLGMFCKSPVNRFLCSVGSYIFFLVMVFIINTSTSRAEGDRGPPDTGLEWFVITFVAGHILSIARDASVGFGRHFFTNAWNIFDIMCQFFFVCAFICWGVASGRVDDPSSKLKALPRKYWGAFEPILVGEIFFALASIVAYGRLVRLLQLDFRIGPLITAMGKMGRDILDVCVFIFILIVGFGAGLYYMYRTYDGWTDLDKHGDKLEQKGFTTVYKTFNLLFFALMAESEAASPVIIERRITDPTNSTSNGTNHHAFTEATGKLTFGAFHLLGTMVAMNLVGGLVISHYTRICDNVDTEWKYVKGQIYYSFGKNFVNPSPLNFVPTLACLARLCQKKRDLSKSKSQDGAGTTIRLLDAKSLQVELIERYVRDKAEIAEAEKADTQIVTSLREDLSELRAQMDKSDRLIRKQMEIANIPTKDTKAPTTEEPNLLVAQKPPPSHRAAVVDSDLSDLDLSRLARPLGQVSGSTPTQPQPNVPKFQQPLGKPPPATSSPSAASSSPFRKPPPSPPNAPSPNVPKFQPPQGKPTPASASPSAASSIPTKKPPSSPPSNVPKFQQSPTKLSQASASPSATSSIPTKKAPITPTKFGLPPDPTPDSKSAAKIQPAKSPGRPIPPPPAVPALPSQSESSMATSRSANPPSPSRQPPSSDLSQSERRRLSDAMKKTQPKSGGTDGQTPGKK